MAFFRPGGNHVQMVASRFVDARGVRSASLMQFSAPATATTQQTCLADYYETYDVNVTSEARGVSAIVFLPGGITDSWRSDVFSSAAVHLEAWSDRSNYIELGWYVGSGSVGNPLPHTSTPRVYMAEWDPTQPNDIRVQLGPALGWAEWHVFKFIYSTSSNYYYFYLDGNYIGRTVYDNHFVKGLPKFRAQVDKFPGTYGAKCVDMFGFARRGTESPNYKSLTFLKFNPTATWHYFTDNYWSDDWPRYDAYYFVKPSGQTVPATAVLEGPL